MDDYMDAKDEAIKNGYFDNFREPDYKLILSILVEQAQIDKEIRKKQDSDIANL